MLFLYYRMNPVTINDRTLSDPEALVLCVVDAQIRSLEVQLAHATAQLKGATHSVPNRRNTMAPPTTTSVRNRRKETTFEASAGMIVIFVVTLIECVMPIRRSNQMNVGSILLFSPQEIS